jgi:hypothetical protein
MLSNKPKDLKAYIQLQNDNLLRGMTLYQEQKDEINRLNRIIDALVNANLNTKR